MNECLNQAQWYSCFSMVWPKPSFLVLLPTTPDENPLLWITLNGHCHLDIHSPLDPLPRLFFRELTPSYLPALITVLHVSDQAPFLHEALLVYTQLSLKYLLKNLIWYDCYKVGYRNVLVGSLSWKFTLFSFMSFLISKDHFKNQSPLAILTIKSNLMS